MRCAYREIDTLGGTLIYRAYFPIGEGLATRDISYYFSRPSDPQSYWKSLGRDGETS